MFEKDSKKLWLCCLFLIFYQFYGPVFCLGAELDKSRYITIDEIKPGMDAWCLTVYKGTEIEKFGLEVVSVIRNLRPGKDAIMVMGTDERFIHTGPVHGCSGSPVYIQGRLAGALAFGWDGSKDPLYGVTPIEEMLRTGSVANSEMKTEQGFSFDFSQPLDLAKIDRKMKADLAAKRTFRGGLSPLLCPIVTSPMPADAYENLKDAVESLGFMAVQGVGGTGGKNTNKNVELAAGASLAVPLVTGDISMAAIGTVTDVVDDKVYGFGHSLLGYGPIDLPMATGEVHTVVSHLIGSFKLATALETVGALTADESTAVVGRIGAKAKMSPLKIIVDRYNDAEKRVYNCQIANNRILTPIALTSAMAGAALMRGSLPPDNMIEYKTTIAIKDFEPVSFSNVSTGLGLAEAVIESTGAVALLLNNPYEKIQITSIDFDCRILNKNLLSHIWSVDLSENKVSAGEYIDVSVITESVLADKKKYRYRLQIPDDLKPGVYKLNIMGGYAYRDFLRKAMPYKFIPDNTASLIEALNFILNIDKDRLYCVFQLPAGGMTVEKAELPNLPATKALILADTKRTLKTAPYSRQLEKSFDADAVIVDNKIMQITVEK